MGKRRYLKYMLAALALIVLLAGYSVFFRNFLDPDSYLELAYNFTGRDSTIIDWQNPDFELTHYEGKMVVHIIFSTTEDRKRGPIGVYINPWQKKVIGEDPRTETDGQNQLIK